MICKILGLIIKYSIGKRLAVNHKDVFTGKYVRKPFTIKNLITGKVSGESKYIFIN